MDLTLTTLSNGPEAIGRDPQTGQAVFVPWAIPGETVRAEVLESRPTFARARLVEVLSPSPDRVAPACPHFGVCGGCHYQHMAYDAQLRWKRQILVEQLVRVGGLETPNVLETLPAPEPWHYRNHIQLSQADDGRLGYISAGPDKAVLPITDCPIARPELLEILEQLDIEKLDVEQIGLRVGSDGEVTLVFETGAGEAPDVELDLPVSVAAVNAEGEALTLIGSDHIVQEVEGRAFRVSAGSFFQVNTAQAGALVRLALAALDPAPADIVLDLYCGAGLFTAFIAARAGRVVGIEAFGPAVRDASANLDEFDNVELYEAPVEAALAHVVDGLAGTPTKVLLDPPRAGCDKAVTAELLRLAPARLVYVSCDPATLARDARRLAAGGYRLVSAQPVDMFPQTHHIETVAVFER